MKTEYSFDNETWYDAPEGKAFVPGVGEIYLRMTNETTASQPKSTPQESIGDDAQAKAWMIWLHGPCGTFENKDDAQLEIDRRNKLYPDTDRKLLELRAPAAQASATIQAAPEGTAMQRYKECSGDDEPSALERLRFFCSLALNGRDWLDSENFFSDLAAVIQEPVMVAEPVGGNEQLMRFYAVETTQALINAQEQHIAKLQAKLPRDTQPAFTRVREG